MQPDADPQSTASGGCETLETDDLPLCFAACASAHAGTLVTARVSGPFEFQPYASWQLTDTRHPRCRWPVGRTTTGDLRSAQFLPFCLLPPIICVALSFSLFALLSCTESFSSPPPLIVPNATHFHAFPRSRIRPFSGSLCRSQKLYLFPSAFALQIPSLSQACRAKPNAVSQAEQSISSPVSPPPPTKKHGRKRPAASQTCMSREKK